jgi:hypothetical protein
VLPTTGYLQRADDECSPEIKKRIVLFARKEMKCLFFAREETSCLLFAREKNTLQYKKTEPMTRHAAYQP